MTRSVFVLSLGAALLVTGSLAQAQARQTLPAGAVACLTQRQAADYQSFQVSAPAFAQDLLDRAACYVIKQPTQAISRGGTRGYAQYQLLSGHKVWLPDASAPRKNTP